jgi:hypothetical protein
MPLKADVLEKVLILLPLFAPLALLMTPWRQVRLTLSAILFVQLSALLLSGCMTSALQCTSVCNSFYPMCEDGLDRNDSAILGLWLLCIASCAIDCSLLGGRFAFRWARSKAGT